MPIVESLQANSSRTIPQGGYFADSAFLTDLNYGTPRYSWGPGPGPESSTCRYRLVAEASFTQDDEAGEAGEFGDVGLDDMDFSIVLIDPQVDTPTGTGYRSPYRTFLGMACWPFSDYSIALQPCSPLQGDVDDVVVLRHQGDPRTRSDETAFDPVKKVLADWLLRVIHQQRVKETTSSTLFKLHGADPVPEVGSAPSLPMNAQDTHIGAIRWLEEHADLSQGAISDLIGVSRQTVQNWIRGTADIRDENRQRLLAVQEVLQRAQRRGRGGETLKTWLDTPQGIQGTTPRQLLENNEIGKARALALSTAPLRPRVAPQWLRESPPDPWTERQRRRRDRFAPEEPHLDVESSDATDE